MTTVLLRNTTYPSAADADGGLDTDADAVAARWWWNLWARRDFPFAQLTDGTYIAVAQTWPGGSRITWLVQATDVHTAVHSGPDAAIADIAAWTGLGESAVRRDRYTAARAALARGVVLVWRSAPVRWLGVPRPAGMALRRTGWGATTLAELEQLSGPAAVRHSRPAAGGPGRRLDVEARNAVERRAVDVALAWCHTQGWTGARHVGEQRLGWDVQGTVAGADRFVEVKGTTGALGAVEVTRNEVAKATEKGRAYALAVVHGIDLRVGQRGEVAAVGGTLVVYDPWLPVAGELDAQRYTWRRGHT